MEDWGFSVHSVLGFHVVCRKKEFYIDYGFQDNSIYTLHLYFG